jgi:hypothetical protein
LPHSFALAARAELELTGRMRSKWRIGTSGMTGTSWR